MALDFLYHAWFPRYHFVAAAGLGAVRIKYKLLLNTRCFLVSGGLHGNPKSLGRADAPPLVSGRQWLSCMPLASLSLSVE